MTINHVRSPCLTTRRPDGMLMTGLSFDCVMTHACRLFIRQFGPHEHDQPYVILLKSCGIVLPRFANALLSRFEDRENDCLVSVNSLAEFVRKERFSCSIFRPESPQYIEEGQVLESVFSQKGSLFLRIDVLRHSGTAFPSDLSVLLRSV